MRELKPLAILVIASLLLLAGGRQDSPSRAVATVTSQPIGPVSAPATTPTSGPAFANPQTIPGVGNFAKISDTLYRGEQPTAEGFVQLKKMGIKTIVSLRWLHSDKDELKGLGFRYVHIPSKAWHPEDEDIIAFLKIVSDPANQPVFVHCQQGADRTGCAVAVYRIVQQDWSTADATKELELFGFHPVFGEITTYLRRFNAPAMRKKIEAAKAPAIETIE